MKFASVDILDQRLWFVALSRLGEISCLRN